MTPHANGVRICTTCKALCTADGFHRGERSRCKECARRRIAQWRARRAAPRTRRAVPPRAAGFVRTDDLTRLIRAHLGEQLPSARRLATLAKIDRHTAADILAHRRTLTTLRVGDRICTALGVHIDMLQAVDRNGQQPE